MTRVRRIICSECGVMVENPHRNQKYCPDCRIKVAREQRAISHRREREKKKKQREELHTMDNARMMAVCLNCKREPQRCTGVCKDVLSVGKEAAYGA